QNRGRAYRQPVAVRSPLRAYPYHEVAEAQLGVVVVEERAREGRLDVQITKRACRAHRREAVRPLAFVRSKGDRDAQAIRGAAQLGQLVVGARRQQLRV